MKRIIKKIFVAVVAMSAIFLTGCNKIKSDKITIVTSNFPGYDFVRAIVKDSEDIEVKMLLKPGSEMHDFEPTPQDIKDIKNSKLFIYIGGESDEWIDDILDDINIEKTKVIKLMDLVETVEEEYVEGMEEEREEHDEADEIERDEHVWTSPINAITITSKLKDEIIRIDENNKELYEKNASSYIDELTNIDKTIKELVANAKRKELIFADRFPFRYFTDEYGLTYYAAFKGCSEQTEASAKTIAFLINKVKQDKIPVVLHIELSDKRIANSISKETNAKILEFNSAHNISLDEFNEGITIVDIMKNNIKVLKEALY